MKKTKKLNLHKQDGFKIFLLALTVIAVLLSVLVVNTSKISGKPQAVSCYSYTVGRGNINQCPRSDCSIVGSGQSRRCVVKSTAQPARAGAEDDKKCRTYYPLYNKTPKPFYDWSYDYCRTISKEPCSGSFYTDSATTLCGLGNSCCRKLDMKYFNSPDTNYYNINDGYCRQATGDLNSTCVSNSYLVNCPSGKTDLGKACKIKSGQKLVNGKCCGVVANTPTPTLMPTPTPALHTSNEDCGADRINCTLSYSSPQGNFHMPPEYLIRCTNWLNTSNYECFFVVPSTTTTCDGMQFANPVFFANTGSNSKSCLVGIKGNTAGSTSGNILCPTKFYKDIGGSDALTSCIGKMGKDKNGN